MLFCEHEEEHKPASLALRNLVPVPAVKREIMGRKDRVAVLRRLVGLVDRGDKDVQASAAGKILNN
jgi:hypothetical protein